MYNKLFTKILDSTIWLAPSDHRIVWITLIAAMDQDGLAEFGSIENLAARARVKLDVAQKAIKDFEAPDKHDRTQEFEGRRIERVPGGWLVLNAVKYRDIVTSTVAREKSRERMRKFRERKEKTVGDGALRSVTPSEAEAEATTDIKNPTARKAAPTTQDFPDWFIELKSVYPARAGDQGWGKALRAARARIAEGHDPTEIIEGARRYRDFIASTGKGGSEFVKQAATFCGPDKPFLLPWKLPEQARTAMDEILEANSTKGNTDGSGKAGRTFEHDQPSLTALESPLGYLRG